MALLLKSNSRPCALGRVVLTLVLFSMMRIEPVGGFVSHHRLVSVLPTTTVVSPSGSLSAPRRTRRCFLQSTNNNNPDNSDDKDEEAERLRRQAEQLREQIRSMEQQMADSRSARRAEQQPPAAAPKTLESAATGRTLHNKRILVAGANGRLGSLVCRHLLRNHPTTEVVAMCHTIGENSPTARGYGRLAYEVGAEDGVGSIGPAWSAEDRTATFMYDESMRDYNLQNLRLVECELLDPVQCQSVVEGCDAVVWCATDFDGNAPRAVSSLNVALLFRAVTRPDKGRVEVEGFQNMLGALKQAQNQKRSSAGGLTGSNNDPINVVLVSVDPNVFRDVETPLGTFKSIKQQGEAVCQDFPSLSHTVLRMGMYDDNFTEEGQDVLMEGSSSNNNDDASKSADDQAQQAKSSRRIHRRDAARAVVEALTNEDIAGKTVDVWTTQPL